ncbi:hypothetical protein AB0M32_30265 [Streptomyces sp. NPDC051985]|uniref:hypothetical protein n=1 Tax=Streptomyces sp. NPDC051985 TaxID=3155807 RepID=UPI003429B229
MSRFMTRHARSPRPGAAVVGAALVFALTACGSGSDTDAASAPSGSAAATEQGVVGRAAAQKVVDTYEKVNNQANAGLDAKLLATVEGGQAYAMDQATYALAPTWSAKDKKAYRKPFYYRDRQYVIPAKGSWFAVGATSSEDGHSSVLLVFDKADGAYKMVMSVWADDGQPLPKPALDAHGLAEAVDPAAKVGAFAPADVGAAFDDLYATGGAKAGKNLATTKPVDEAAKIYRDATAHGTADGIATKRFFTKTPADTSVYALRTADGGVLALFPVAHNQEQLVKEVYRSSRELVPTDEESTLGAHRGPVITDVFQGQGAAVLTAKATKVTAMSWQQVDSH